MEHTDNQKKYIESVDGAAHMSAVEIIGEIDELYRIAIVHAREYKSWVEKAEAENTKFRLALENILKHQCIITGHGMIIKTTIQRIAEDALNKA